MWDLSSPTRDRICICCIARWIPNHCTAREAPVLCFEYVWVHEPGGGNDDPLQQWCLGNPMDRGAWPVTVQGVAKNGTWLRDWATVAEQTTATEHRMINKWTDLATVALLWLQFLFHFWLAVTIGEANRSHWTRLAESEGVSFSPQEKSSPLVYGLAWVASQVCLNIFNICQWGGCHFLLVKMSLDM